jgi:hypothetical protein
MILTSEIAEARKEMPANLRRLKEGLEARGEEERSWPSE